MKKFLEKNFWKKIFLAFFALNFFLTNAFSQDESDSVSENTPPLQNENPIFENPDSDSKRKHLFGSTYTPPHGAKEFWKQVSPFANVGVVLTINTADKTESAPSPVNFSFSVGAIWPNNAFVSFQPRLSFYTTYYLWSDQDECAYPAEVENRTAKALSLLLDIPAAATFRFEKCQVEAGLGIALLARLALQARDVGKDEIGASDERTAGQDKKDIQKWFWQNCRFLYPELFVAWEYNFSEKLKAGLEVRYYLSLGALMDGRGFDSSIFAFCAKVIF